MKIINEILNALHSCIRQTCHKNFLIDQSIRFSLFILSQKKNLTFTCSCVIIISVIEVFPLLFDLNEKIKNPFKIKLQISKKKINLILNFGKFSIVQFDQKFFFDSLSPISIIFFFLKTILFCIQARRENFSMFSDSFNFICSVLE